MYIVVICQALAYIMLISEYYIYIFSYVLTQHEIKINHFFLLKSFVLLTDISSFSDYLVYGRGREKY